MFDALLSDEERALRDEVRSFVANEVPSEMLKAMDAEEIRYPREFLQKLGQANLLGLRFDKKWGGRGLPWTSEMIALEEIGVLSSSLGCLYSLPSIVGQALNFFGNDAQCEKYLRPMLAGEKTCAEALTEPRGGSDFFGATCVARREGDDYIISGQKRFVVGAEGADFFLLYAKTGEDPDPHKNISVFVVERDDSVVVHHIYGLMGTRGGGAGRIQFKDSRVPAANLIGKEGQGAEIFNTMMLPERMTSAGGAIGAARAALEVATRYSTKRKAFGRKIQKFQAVSFAVADAVSLLDSARALSHIAAGMIDSGADARRLVSEAKKVATENSWEVINKAMQIMGGIGYTDVFPIERLLRDARLTMIWTGTNEIMNLMIQHEYYKELAQDQDSKRPVENDAINAEAEDEKIYD